jgi:hypothetical protein
MRTCNKCGAAENPLGKLRFKKHVDRAIYCENCLPGLDLTQPILPPSRVEEEGGPAYVVQEPASDYTVIVCPTCRGLHPGAHGKTCPTCVGYGAVRIRASVLPIYREPAEKSEQAPAPQILTEG